MQAPPPGRRASRHRRGFRSEGSPCADESTVALRLSTPAGELRIRVGQCPGISPEEKQARPRRAAGPMSTLEHLRCSWQHLRGAGVRGRLTTPSLKKGREDNGETASTGRSVRTGRGRVGHRSGARCRRWAGNGDNDHA